MSEKRPWSEKTYKRWIDKYLGLDEAGWALFFERNKESNNKAMVEFIAILEILTEKLSHTVIGSIPWHLIVMEIRELEVIIDYSVTDGYPLERLLVNYHRMGSFISFTNSSHYTELDLALSEKQLFIGNQSSLALMLKAYDMGVEISPEISHIFDHIQCEEKSYVYIFRTLIISEKLTMFLGETIMRFLISDNIRTVDNNMTMLESVVFGPVEHITDNIHQNDI